MLPTLLRLGKRSKLAFVDPPNARCSTSRSAGEGAKARKSELVFAEDVAIIREPSPFGLSASNTGLAGAGGSAGGGPMGRKSGGVLLKRKTLASGFKPFFCGFSFEDVENQRRGGRVLSPFYVFVLGCIHHWVRVSAMWQWHCGTLHVHRVPPHRFRMSHLEGIVIVK